MNRHKNLFRGTLMIQLKLLVVLLPMLVLISCRSVPSVRHSFIIVTFEEVSLVVEGAASPEEVFLIQKGDLKFVQDENLGYRMEGSGGFSVRGIEFLYDPPRLVCQRRGFDISQGAVVVKTDGTLVPANLLPLIAK